MSATNLDVQWNHFPLSRPSRVDLLCNHTIGSRIRMEPSSHRCPSCDSIIYCRRHRWCGVCGQVLPDDCRFTASEAQDVVAIVEVERQAHKAWLKRAAGN